MRTWTSRLSLDKPFMTWKDIFHYRGLWMFAAIVCIILYHAPHLPLHGPIIQRLQIYGYGGVDIFLFSSGLGCWFSLKKDSDILRFLQRRAWRILPMFLLSLAVWTAYCCTASSMTLPQFIGNILGHGTLANQENQLNWYFACLWVCYFAAPFFFALLQAYPSVLAQAVVTCLLAVFSISFARQPGLLLWSRIPVFFLGLCLGQASGRTGSLSRGGFLAALLAMAIGFVTLRNLFVYHRDWLTAYGGWWYPFLLIAPGFCFLLSSLAFLAEKTPLGVLVRLCIHAGDYTLPLSLTHVIVFQVTRDLLGKGVIAYNWMSCILPILLSVVWAVCLQAIDRFVQRRRHKKAG